MRRPTTNPRREAVRIAKAARRIERSLSRQRQTPDLQPLRTRLKDQEQALSAAFRRLGAGADGAPLRPLITDMGRTMAEMVKVAEREWERRQEARTASGEPLRHEFKGLEWVLKTGKLGRYL